MMHAILDRLLAAQTALIEALEGSDPAAIAHGAASLGEALSGLTALSPLDRSVQGRVREALRLAEDARARINYLADRNRRRLEQLTAAAGLDPGQSYQRDIRLA